MTDSCENCKMMEKQCDSMEDEAKHLQDMYDVAFDDGYELGYKSAQENVNEWLEALER